MPLKAKPLPTIMPSFTIPAQALQNQAGTNSIKPGMPSIPLPLLILNSLQPQNQNNQDKKEAVSSSGGGAMNDRVNNGECGFKSCIKFNLMINRAKVTLLLI